MEEFKNNPQLKNADNKNMVRRFRHQPLKGEDRGVKYEIQENGRVKIARNNLEVEVPASLIFKLNTLLKATKEVTYAAITEEEK